MPVARLTAAPTRCTDGRRRGGDDHVDPLPPHDPDRRRDRGQVPADVLVGHEQPAACEVQPAPRRARAPSSRAAPRPACGPSGPGSARGAPTRASAAAGPRRGGSTSGRPARARASRSRAPAGASRTSAAAARRRRPAGGKYIVTSRTFTAGDDRGGRPGSPSVAPYRLATRGSLGQHPVLHRACAAVRVVRLRVRDVRDRRSDDVDRSTARRSGSSRLSGASTTAPLRHLRAQAVDEPPARARAGRLRGRGLQCAKPCTATGRTKSAGGGERRAVVLARAVGRRRAGPTTSASRAADERDPGRGRRAAVAQAVVEVARPEPLERRSRRRARPGARSLHRASSARPPAKANGERDEAGDAARLRERDGVREVDEEPRHERQQQDETEPPSANAAHRRRSASAASGSRSSAATATAPLRPKTSAASRKWWSTRPRAASP